LAGGDVDADDLVHQNLGVPVLAQDGADGLGDVSRREHGKGYLVEQRLKGMMVSAVYHGDVYREMGQAVGGVNSGKAATDDYHAGAAGGRFLVFSGFGEFAQFVRLSA
jgi:hypothetical protein